MCFLRYICEKILVFKIIRPEVLKIYGWFQHHVFLAKIKVPKSGKSKQQLQVLFILYIKNLKHIYIYIFFFFKDFTILVKPHSLHCYLQVNFLEKFEIIKRTSQSNKYFFVKCFRKKQIGSAFTLVLLALYPTWINL